MSEVAPFAFFFLPVWIIVIIASGAFQRRYVNQYDRRDAQCPEKFGFRRCCKREGHKLSHEAFAIGTEHRVRLAKWKERTDD